METWDPYPEVNNPELDAEHRALGATVRALLEAMRQDDRDRALRFAHELTAGVQRHFAHEEALMREVSYPNASRHMQAHERFLADALLQIELVRTKGLSADVLRWAGQLDEWFQRHVVTEDLWLAHAVSRAREAGRPATAK